MHTFYVQFSTTGTVLLSEVESKHAAKALRIKQKELVLLVNGNGKTAKAEVIDNHHKKCVLEIIEIREMQPLPYYLHIAIAPTKNIDRFEWFLEKATEIGISEVTPILSQNSERKTIKPERLNKIIIAAMKQSQRAYLPQLNPLIPLNDFLANTKETNKYIAHCEGESKKTLSQVHQKQENTLILIGPEGDFSNSEIELARALNFKEISLGNYRLRTETAGIVACNQIAILNE